MHDTEDNNSIELETSKTASQATINVNENVAEVGVGGGSEGGGGAVVQSNVPTPVLVENWPTAGHSFGQITAVSIDPQGNPVIFHRAERYWDAK